MTQEAKTIAESMVETRELVIPNDTNLLGNLLGGRLMHLVDVTAAMAASRHAGCNVVTACIDSVDFAHPVRLGEMVVIKAKLTWTGRTSMEVMVEVFSENYLTSEIKFTNKAYVTFVALDEHCRPRPVPSLILLTDEERKENEAAKLRRAERLRRIGKQ